MAEEVEPPSGTELFDSPEGAALSGWRSTPSARARVIAVEPGSDDAVSVTVLTDGRPGFHDRDISTCLRAPNGQWYAMGSVGA